MTIELRVNPRQQTSPMSCWWACLAMILEYYGQNYALPQSFRSQFARPANRPRSPFPQTRNPMRDMRNTDELPDPEEWFDEPSEWYTHGMPRARSAFRLLTQITGFRGFSRPAFGEWTGEDVASRLRTYGPFAFFGFWNGFPHVILTTGFIETASGPQVVIIDPARGFPVSQSLKVFNFRMRTRMREFSFNNLNPLYYPTDGDAVRDTISHDPPPVIPNGLRSKRQRANRR